MIYARGFVLPERAAAIANVYLPSHMYLINIVRSIPPLVRASESMPQASLHQSSTGNAKSTIRSQLCL